MLLAVGEEIDERDLQPTRHRYAAAWAALPKPGWVQRVGSVDAALGIPGVEHVFLRVKEGEEVLPYRDCAARPGFVIATGGTADDALLAAQRGAAALEIDTVPATSAT
jgi:hypothetical protein